MTNPETAQGVQAVLPSPGTWTLDPAHSSARFSARHMMVATVRGEVKVVSGTLVVPEGDPLQSKVEVEMDPASITTGNPDRDAHLRSADFLDVEHFPKMTFKSTAVSDEGAGRYHVTGELTIRGVTKTVELEVDYNGMVRDPYGNDRIGFEASGEINRHDFGASWNAALEAGGIVVGDRVKLSIDAEFTKPAS